MGSEFRLFGLRGFMRASDAPRQVGRTESVAGAAAAKWIV